MDSCAQGPFYCPALGTPLGGTVPPPVLNHGSRVCPALSPSVVSRGGCRYVHGDQQAHRGNCSRSSLPFQEEGMSLLALHLLGRLLRLRRVDTCSKHCSTALMPLRHARPRRSCAAALCHSDSNLPLLEVLQSKVLHDCDWTAQDDSICGRAHRILRSNLGCGCGHPQTRGLVPVPHAP